MPLKSVHFFTKNCSLPVSSKNNLFFMNIRNNSLLFMNNGISRLFNLNIHSSNFAQKVAQPNSVETPGTAGPQDRKLQLP